MLFPESPSHPIGQAFEEHFLGLTSFKSAVPYLALSVFTAVFLYPFVRLFSNAPDSGIYLNGAALVCHGALPARDFVELQGPGAFLWLALAFRIFGATFETARIVLELTGILSALLILFLARRLGSSGFSAVAFTLALSIPLLAINSPHYEASLFALAVTALFVASYPPSSTALIVCAIPVGLIAWTFPQTGAYLALAFLAAIIAEFRAKCLKPALCFALPCLVLCLLPLAFYAATGALHDLFYANYIWPLNHYAYVNSASYGFPIWRNFAITWSAQSHTLSTFLQDFVVALPFLGVAALPFLAPLAAALSAKRWFQKEILPAWLTAYALWLSELHRMDIGHLRNGVVLLAVLFFSICETGKVRVLKYSGVAMAASALFAASLQFLSNWREAAPVETRRGRVWLKQPDPLLTFLAANTKPGDSVFIYPYQPIYYFAENLRNPTRYSNLTYGLNTAQQFREALLSIDSSNVRYVIFDTQFSGPNMISVFPAYRQPSPAQLIVEPYLESHYKLAKDLGRFRVLERLPNPIELPLRPSR